MNIDEFGKWSPYNNDNPKYSGDEYNRSFIKERFECPDEYEGSDFDEYYSVPKMSDSFEFKREKNSSSDKESGKDKNKGRLRQNMIRQVVCLAAGSVIITTSYQSVIKQQQQIPKPDNVPSYNQTQDVPAEETPAEQSETWNWSEDNQTVILEIIDDKGNTVDEMPAAISVSETEPTCNKPGIKIYTATVNDGDNTYTDTRTETIEPLGHDFGEGNSEVSPDGETAITFECSRCHEQFTIRTSITEND